MSHWAWTHGFSKTGSGSRDAARWEVGGWKQRRKEASKQASPGLEDMPELQPRAQVHYWHFEDAQDWSSKEGAALDGDKSEDTGKLTQCCRCTVSDPRKPSRSPHIPGKATVPTQKHP